MQDDIDEMVEELLHGFLWLHVRYLFLMEDRIFYGGTDMEAGDGCKM